MNHKKIFLITMPLCGNDHPHVGVAYLTASLNACGYQAIQMDLNIEIRSSLTFPEKEICSKYSRKWSKFEDYKSDVLPIIEPYLDKYAEELAENDAGIIGFSMYYSNVYSTFELAKKIKSRNPQKIIILGGPEASAKYAVFDCVDFIIKGEGEESLPELLDAINCGLAGSFFNGNKKVLKQLDEIANKNPKVSQFWNQQDYDNFQNIQGLVFRMGENIVDTGERSRIKNLDKLPIPEFQNFLDNKYNYQCVPILGSRGCINRCIFCTETKFWNSFRARSAESIFQEFVEHKERYGAFQNNGEPREFVFLDSLINARIPELLKLCRLLIENETNIQWVGKIAASNPLTLENLKLLKKAGCKKLMLGIESGSPSVVKSMRKHYEIQVAERILKDANACGIDMQIYMVIGFPTETDELFQETLQFVLRNRDWITEIVPGVGCQVEKESDLFINQEYYGVSWEHKIERNSANWYSENSNNDIRIKRINDFIKFCHDNKIKVITASLEAAVPQLIDNDNTKLIDYFNLEKSNSKIQKLKYLIVN